MLDIKLKLRQGHTNERTWMRPSDLKQLMWNVTYACNYGCPICFTSAGKRHADELTTAEARLMIRNAHEASVRDIIISGGEPFMRPDMLELLSFMAEFGITARIASNGSLLTRDLLERLRRDTLTKSFQISIETLDPDLYNRLHGTSGVALEVALNSLRLIQESGLHTTISVRVTPDTIPGMTALLDHACAEGWATVTLHCPLHTGRTSGAYPQDADILSSIEPVLQHFAALPEKWLVETYIPWAPYHPVMKRLENSVKVIHRGCSAGRDRLSIHPTGAVSPCICMDISEAYLGNVRQDDFRALFKDSWICNLLRDPAQHGVCASCANLPDCGGGCRAAAIAVTGVLTGQDRSCPVWQAKRPGTE
jgi:radical SAM protein with 4Fe4S-binding SPASM domain